MSSILNVYLSKVFVGQLALLNGDRSFFAFDEAYLNNPNHPTFSQSFIQPSGELIPETKITKTKLPSFFSNLLPEGHLRAYLAEQGKIKPAREFKLIEWLGEDLPGAVIIRPAGEVSTEELTQENTKTTAEPLRFSLAGVQLKFSAMTEKNGGLTIPAKGIGGTWIIKLPAQNFLQVPENEWSMLNLAAKAGITVPETRLVSVDEISGLPDLGVLSDKQALVVKRFDRDVREQRIHIEDFAQVYNVYPHDKYNKVSYTNIANMIWTLTGEAGLIEYIRRLAFTIIIGNGDMHLKNWSFIYYDKHMPQLSPAYDFVSTIPYLPNDSLGLSLSGTKNFTEITLNHFEKLADKSASPKHLVLNAVKETKEKVYDAWHAHKKDYPLSCEIQSRIDRHMKLINI